MTFGDLFYLTTAPVIGDVICVFVLCQKQRSLLKIYLVDITHYLKQQTSTHFTTSVQNINHLQQRKSRTETFWPLGNENISAYLLWLISKNNYLLRNITLSLTEILTNIIIPYLFWPSFNPCIILLHFKQINCKCKLSNINLHA